MALHEVVIVILAALVLLLWLRGKGGCTSHLSGEPTPPEHYCPTPEEEQNPYQTYSLLPRCPWCKEDLELQNRVTWIRYCPQCPYVWVPTDK